MVDVGWWLDHDKLNEYPLVIKHGNETMEHRPWDDMPAINPIDVGFSSTKFDHQRVPVLLWLHAQVFGFAHGPKAGIQVGFCMFLKIFTSGNSLYGYVWLPRPSVPRTMSKHPKSWRVDVGRCPHFSRYLEGQSKWDTEHNELERSTIFVWVKKKYFDWAIFNSYVSHYQRIWDFLGVINSHLKNVLSLSLGGSPLLQHTEGSFVGFGTPQIAVSGCTENIEIIWKSYGNPMEILWKSLNPMEFLW